MIVTAQIYIGNMSAKKQTFLLGMHAHEIKMLTGFAVHKITRDDCLANWEIHADEHSPHFVGEAFVREDFVDAILKIVEDVK